MGVRGNYTLEANAQTRNAVRSRNEKAFRENKKDRASMHPGRNTKRVSHCGLTVAKNCHDSENGCKWFGGHNLWASDAAVGFVHSKKA